ncbi:MAG: formyltetrahydrofolate deformylase [Sulfobacillus thermotolerans]|uniref:Formyltetrahydrofolate deformylase n=1 Tax=Sulfobacillus thermotolerans TaxID=338644 RepID=A0ABM6RU41_9FIRM|nr:formyltetrahydrofolate deformylase [Sulfobacillus thermotolerans]MCY0906766.1 formyltetrahydrofolate deformylase [Sulfobacillus thermotolerans]
MTDRYRLLIACPDTPGIIASVSDALWKEGANITSFDQYSEGLENGMFYMRAEFDAAPGTDEPLTSRLQVMAEAYRMQWTLALAGRPQRLAVFVSREDHCLNELLWQTQRGDIAAHIALIISNHADLQPLAERFNIPYYHIPVTQTTKAHSEAEARRLIESHDAQTIVLARYMQILSEDFVSAYPERIINIHHSFLPAFVGPKPYHQAYARGVKLIGATAHYVTKDLDAGPIIEQDVHRVDHRHQLEDLKRLGRQVERMVLARAVSWHVSDRVLVSGNRTVVFPF